MALEQQPIEKSAGGQCRYGTMCPMFRMTQNIAEEHKEFINTTTLRHVMYFAHAEDYDSNCTYGVNCYHWKRVSKNKKQRILDEIHCNLYAHGPAAPIPFELDAPKLLEAIELMHKATQFTDPISQVPCSYGTNCSFWKRSFIGSRDNAVKRHMAQCTHTIIKCRYEKCTRKEELHRARYSHDN